MKNWNAIHECEDECDTEHLHKKANIMKESQLMTQALMDSKSNNEAASEDYAVTASENSTSLEQEPQSWLAVSHLQSSNWFAIPDGDKQITKKSALDMNCCSDLNNLQLSPSIITHWKKEIKEQELHFVEFRQNVLHPESQMGNQEIPFDNNNIPALPFQDPNYDPRTVATHNTTEMSCHDDLIESIRIQFQLNER